MGSAEGQICLSKGVTGKFVFLKAVTGTKKRPCGRAGVPDGSFLTVYT